MKKKFKKDLMLVLHTVLENQVSIMRVLQNKDEGYNTIYREALDKQIAKTKETMEINIAKHINCEDGCDGG